MGPRLPVSEVDWKPGASKLKSDCNKPEPPLLRGLDHANVSIRIWISSFAREPAEQTIHSI